MDVGIHQSGHNEFVFSAKNFHCPVGIEFGFHPDHLSAGQAKIVAAMSPIGRIRPDDRL